MIENDIAVDTPYVVEVSVVSQLVVECGVSIEVFNQYLEILLTDNTVFGASEQVFREFVLLKHLEVVGRWLFLSINLQIFLLSVVELPEAAFSSKLDPLKDVVD